MGRKLKLSHNEVALDTHKMAKIRIWQFQILMRMGGIQHSHMLMGLSGDKAILGKQFGNS